MKLNKQKVVALALVVCLIATLSLGSLAWFTDDDFVTNDFNIAGSEDQNPDDVFSVDVWEDATPDDPDGEDKIQDGIKFDNILPGDDLYKEVNVENTGAYDQYIRVTVTVTEARIWQEIYKEHFVDLSKIATDLNADFQIWSIVCDEVNNTLTYVLYYNAILPFEGEDVVTLFTKVEIPEALTRDQAAEMDGGFQISAIAEAVQTENVGDDAVAAFETVGMSVKSGNYCIMKNATIETKSSDWIRQSTLLQNVVINSAGVGLQTAYADVVLKNVDINAGGSYANTLFGGTVVYDDVNVAAAGGGIAALDKAVVEFNAGSVTIDSTITAQRHVFYAEGEGSVITVNDGEFAFEAYRQRTYACAVNGATIYITGGNFGVAPNHPRWTAPIYEEGGEVIITGGTFGFNPSEWVADGYQAVETNGVWTVSAK